MPFLATGFGAFLMRQAFLMVPGELRDAAALDGYGHMRFLPGRGAARPAGGRGAHGVRVPRRVEPVPLAAPDHQGRLLRTVQIGLRELVLSLDQVNVTFAGAIIAVIPLVILLLVFQQQLVRGLTAGAVKG